jgi:hypothetical protein
VFVVASWNAASLSGPTEEAFAHSGGNTLALVKITLIAARLITQDPSPSRRTDALGLVSVVLAETVNAGFSAVGNITTLASPSLLAAANTRSDAVSMTRAILRADWIAAVRRKPSRGTLADTSTWLTVAMVIATRRANGSFGACITGVAGLALALVRRNTFSMGAPVLAVRN